MYLPIINILASINIFSCLTGILYYGGRLIQFRRSKERKIDIGLYFFFFLLTFASNVGNWLVLNFSSIWGESISNYNLLELIYKFMLLFGGLGFLFLTLITHSKSSTQPIKKRILQFIILYGCLTLFLIIISNMNVTGFENSIMLISYSPSFTITLIIFFPLISGSWYGWQTFSEYYKRYHSKYGVSSFHYLYISLSILAFLELIIAVTLRLLFHTPEMGPLITTMIFMSLVAFPTFRWIYIEQYHRRVIEIQRNNLLDVINHDLTNISHLMLMTLESLNYPDQKEEYQKVDVEILLSQVMRMSDLIEKARNSVRTGIIEDN